MWQRHSSLEPDSAHTCVFTPSYSHLSIHTFLFTHSNHTFLCTPSIHIYHIQTFRLTHRRPRADCVSPGPSLHNHPNTLSYAHHPIYTFLRTVPFSPSHSHVPMHTVPFTPSPSQAARRLGLGWSKFGSGSADAARKDTRRPAAPKTKPQDYHENGCGAEVTAPHPTRHPTPHATAAHTRRDP